MSIDKKPMAEYVKMPTLEVYSEWFKDYFDLYREDGILQVTMKTKDGPMYWSGGAHRAMSQLARIISMDHENEIIIWTHKGDNWMQDSDPHGWEDYNNDRFNHQFFDDTNITKNMLFDIDVPTIGVIPGPGFHWDAALLCDITIIAENCKFDDGHLSNGLVPGDGMGLILQQLLGPKRAAYLMYTCRMFDAQQALDWGFVNEVTPKGEALKRGWEIARLIKKSPFETRTVTANLVKRPMKMAFAQDLKLHNFAELASTFVKISQNDIGDSGKGQISEEKMGMAERYRFSPDSVEFFDPPTEDSWNYYDRAEKWYKEKYGEYGKKQED